MKLLALWLPPGKEELEVVIIELASQGLLQDLASEPVKQTRSVSTLSGLASHLELSLSDFTGRVPVLLAVASMLAFLRVANHVALLSEAKMGGKRNLVQ